MKKARFRVRTIDSAALSDAGARAQAVAHKAGAWGAAKAAGARAGAGPVLAAASDVSGDVRERIGASVPAITGALSAALASGEKAGPAATRRKACGLRRGKAAAKPGKGCARTCSKRRGLLVTLLLALTAAVGAYWYKVRREQQDDPWARPLTDPYAAPTTGRQSTVAPGAGDDAGAAAGPASPASEQDESGQSSAEQNRNE